MTDAECAETLSEFRKLTLGPDLSAALDHAIAKLRRDVAFSGPLIETRPWVERGGGSVSGDFFDGVVMNSRAIDLAAA